MENIIFLLISAIGILSSIAMFYIENQKHRLHNIPKSLNIAYVYMILGLVLSIMFGIYLTKFLLND